MKKRLSREKWESVKRVKWILGIPHSPKHGRGLKAEELALEALRYYQKKKTVFLIRNWWTIKSVVEFRKKGICLIVVRLFDHDGKPKTLEEIKKETKERTFKEISHFLLRQKPIA